MYRCVPIFVALAMLASGCSLPSLSGRHTGGSCSDCRHETGNGSVNEDHAREGIHPRDRMSRLHGRHGMRPRRWPWSRPGAPGTPPGELVPLPRFHPVPVRPVFEPQFDYAPPLLLRPYLAPLEVAAPADEPTPAEPPAAETPAAEPPAVQPAASSAS